MQNLVIFDAAREFARGATELNDAAQAIRDASKDKNADPKKLERMTEDLQKSFEKFGSVEKKLWDEVK